MIINRFRVSSTILQRKNNVPSMWFEANNEYPEAKNVKYVDFLKTIVYKA